MLVKVISVSQPEENLKISSTLLMFCLPGFPFLNLEILEKVIEINKILFSFYLAKH